MSKKSRKKSRERMISLMIREDFTCWICGGVVPLEYELGAPNAPSRDHFVPRSRLKKMEHPNRDVQNNIRLAHRHCNSVRQSRNVNTDLEAEAYRVKLEIAQEFWETEH